MLYGKSAPEAQSTRRAVEVNLRNYELSSYVGAAPVRGHYLEGNEVNDNGLPQGFLVEQPPCAVTEPHFHETNQFQVVVEGGGTFGTQNVSPLSIQYANAHTPYGPIVSGAGGITYFTLRAKWDPGAKYMPESREKLVKGKQRSLLIAGLESDSMEMRVARKSSTIETIIPEEVDRLGAWRLCLGPNQSMVAGQLIGSGGQYVLVSEGSMFLNKTWFTRMSVLFVTNEENPLEIISGKDGLDLLVLQFPEDNTDRTEHR